MVVEIEGKTLPAFSIQQLQISGDWSSVYNKGRVVLGSDTFTADSSTSDKYFFVGAKVSISMDDKKFSYFKILAFNFLQSNPESDATHGDEIELILVSPWYFDSPVKNVLRYGNSSEIAKSIFLDFDTSFTEEMVDPYRKRYQLGSTNLAFLESLRPYMTTDKTPGLLYCNLFGEYLNLKTFNFLISQQVDFILNAPNSFISTPTGSFSLVSSKFYYNENKNIDDTYSYSEIVTELQNEKVDGLTTSVIAPTTFEILSNLDANYIHKTNFGRWDMSPMEQRAVSLRLKLLSEIEFNESVLVSTSLNTDLEIGSKVHVNTGKLDKFRDKVLSTDYIIKSLTYSADMVTEESYTKAVAVPLIKID